MRKTKWICGWVLGAALSLGAVEHANACAFHGYTPSMTLIDILLRTEQVLVARQDPAKLDKYLVVETLVGPHLTEIPITMDPRMRSMLADEPASTVLLARDGLYGPWMEIAFLDDRYREFIFTMMRQQSELQLGNDGKRLRFFAELLNDPSPDIRRLALQELDRAPYGDLKSLRLPKINNLRQDLATGEIELTPIRALLAGLSNDTSFMPDLKAGLDFAVRNDLPFLGAYATAMIELDGQEAVRDIVERYLNQRDLSPVAQERLLQALFIQYKAAPRPTRQLISREVAALLRSSPELEAIAARQFGFLGRGAAAPQSTRSIRSGSANSSSRP